MKKSRPQLVEVEITLFGPNYPDARARGTARLTRTMAIVEKVAIIENNVGGVSSMSGLLPLRFWRETGRRVGEPGWCWELTRESKERIKNG